MKRLSLFIGSVALLTWLAGPQPLVGAAAHTAVAARPALEGEEDAHLECEGQSCVPVPGCGDNQCATDSDCGCSDESREACTPEVGNWYEDTCSCGSPPSSQCNPSEVQQCADQWKIWDSETCTCGGECIWAEPVLVGSDWTNELLWCTSCYCGRYLTREAYYYEQYCQDGRFMYAWNYSFDFYYDDFSWECAGECWAW